MGGTGKKLRLRILTPYATVYEGEADYVLLRTREGDSGIKHGHEPYTALMDHGMLSAYGEGDTETFVVLGGYAAVLDDEVTVMTEVADRPDRIRQTLDELAAARAANREREQANDLDVQQMEMSLRRALVHMDISSYSIIRGHDETPD